MKSLKLMATTAWFWSVILGPGGLAKGGGTDDDLTSGLAAYWSFDEGRGRTCQDSSPNKIPGRLHGPQWVRGRYGRALLFDGQDDYVDCSNRAALRIGGALTVTAWIKPKLRGQQYLISKFAWSIYLGGDPLKLQFETRNSAGDGWAPVLDSGLTIPIDQWTFVAAVYDPRKQRQEIYVNGRLTNSRPRTEPIGGASAVNLVIGRYAASGSQWFCGLLDDVRIYRRALTAGQIRRLRLLTPATRPAEIELTPRLLISKNRVIIDLDWRRLKPLPPKATIELIVNRVQTRSPVEERTIAPLPPSGQTSVILPMAGRPAADYEIRAIVKNARGDPITHQPVTARITWPEKPRWLNSSEGKVDRVLAPWTPIESSVDRTIVVRTWGRRYEFADLPLLQHVETNGCSLLAEPFRIVGAIDAVPIAWRTERVRLVETTPTKAKLLQRASCDGLALSVHTTVEYDGMIRIDWNMEPTRPIRLTHLAVEVPLSLDYAKYLFSYPYGLCDWFTYPGDRRPGALPKRGRIVGHMVPVLWLGDERLGLGLFWESTRNWYNADPNAATQIICRQGKALVRFELIDRTVRLVPAKPAEPGNDKVDSAQLERLAYTFVVQATPVKPMDKTCWDYRIATCPWYGRDYDLLTKRIEGRPALDYLAEKGVRALILANWTKILAYPKPVGHERQLHDLVEQAHARKIKILPYFGFQISELAPEWPILKDEVVGLRSIPDPTVRGIDHYPGEPEQFVDRVCYNSVMQDFLVDGIARLVDEYDIDGVYLDTTAYPSPCVNRLHGCGYIGPDGNVVGTHPISAIRQTLKRIYTVIKTRKREGLVDLHAPVLNMPALSWATSSWQGEGLRRVKDRPILEVIPLDQFRVEYMGRQSGVPAEFLQYTLLGPQPQGYKKAWAIALLHDLPVRLHAQLENIELTAGLWQLFDRFGRKEARWLPYWRNAKYVSIRPQGAYVSLYRHPRNGLLLVVSNLAKTSEQVTIHLDRRQLQLSQPLRAVDGLTGESVACQADQIEITLPYLHWKTIWIPGPR